MIQIKGMVLIFEDMAEDNLPLPKIGGHPAYASIMNHLLSKVNVWLV